MEKIESPIRYDTVVIRLVGGPADGQVFVVPQANIPKFFGVGYPVSRYEPEPGTATFGSSGTTALTESKKDPGYLLGER